MHHVSFFLQIVLIWFFSVANHIYYNKLLMIMVDPPSQDVTRSFRSSYHESHTVDVPFMCVCYSQLNDMCTNYQISLKSILTMFGSPSERIKQHDLCPFFIRSLITPSDYLHLVTVIMLCQIYALQLQHHTTIKHHDLRPFFSLHLLTVLKLLPHSSSINYISRQPLMHPPGVSRVQLHQALTNIFYVQEAPIKGMYW
jgi:hypothetical protein